MAGDLPPVAAKPAQGGPLYALCGFLFLAVVLAALNGPDGQIIYVNPAEIVSVRAPSTELIHPDVKCTLQTADGKLINVTNNCDYVVRRIERAEE